MDGWAFYNGELRHGSKSEGKKYGETIAKGDIVSVMLDTIQVRRIFDLTLRNCFMGAFISLAFASE